MTVWTAHGRKVLDRVWVRPLLGLELTGALSDLGWGAFKVLALPYVASNTHKLLESHPSQTLETLAALGREKRLGEMDMVWKQRFGTWVEKKLDGWEQTDENVRILASSSFILLRLLQMRLLAHIIELTKFVPSLTPFLVRITERALETEEPRADYEASYANSAWVIGACMSCIAGQPAKEWADKVDLVRWTTRVVEQWAWSARPLEGVTSLLAAWYVS